MYQRKYGVTLDGTTGLIMHADDYIWSETISTWLNMPGNKKKGTAGDDRFPAWKWVGYCYTDGKHLVVPADNLMTMLRDGGTQCPTGKGKKTFKQQTQSGLVVNEVGWVLKDKNGNPYDWKKIEAMINNNNFEEHDALAKEMGFMLFGKRAKVGTSKHLRIRPRFDQWSCEGTITVFDENITGPVLQMILDVAGEFSGLGDWRPSAPKGPGPWGKFTAKVVELAK